MQTVAKLFTEVSNSYRDLAAQIKQTERQEVALEKSLGLYWEKRERMLRGEEQMGRMRSVKHAAASTCPAAQRGPGMGRTVWVSIRKHWQGVWWHAAWLSSAPYECLQALPSTAHRHPQQTQPGTGIRPLRILANPILAQLSVPRIDRS